MEGSATPSSSFRTAPSSPTLAGSSQSQTTLMKPLHSHLSDPMTHTHFTTTTIQPTMRPLSQLPPPPPSITQVKPNLFPSLSTQSGSTLPPTASQKQRATKAEVEAKREAALRKRREAQARLSPVKQEGEGSSGMVKREDVVKVKEERERNRRELASRNLAQFGFKVASGISRFGSGKGGIKEVGSKEPEKKIEEWKPDERCSDEQREVLEQVKKGGNVFFTGSAGVGKSFLLNEITRLLEHLQRPFQITATTGIAALQVSGTTIHSWASIGLGKDPIHLLYDRLTKSEEKKKNWCGIGTLIIDEISMMTAELFSKLNILGKLVREDPRPFGGLQLIVSGDFFQLPPVPERDTVCMRCGHDTFMKIPLEDARLEYQKRPVGLNEPNVIRCVDKKLRNGEIRGGCLFEWRQRTFVFETEAWAECDFKVMELTKVFRQSDPEFIAVLEKLRRGVCDDTCVDLLKGCGTALGKGGSIQIRPTNLYPIRAAVDNENQAEFRKLKEEEYVFQASDEARGEWGKLQMKERLKSVPADATLKLKKGAQVLLLANLDVKGGLVNGSRGVIVDWIPRSAAPEVEEAIAAGGGKRRPSGQVGTEEWRAKAAEGFMDHQEKDFYPLVFFAVGIEVLVRPHSWCIDLDKYNTVARTQIPLQLAWALTIHKSQGQSLDAVCVRLTSTFEKGQAYVALSRCRTPAGMIVDGFRKNVVMAHPTVIAFYDRIALGQPFYSNPIAVINPLAYIPSFDPLIDKLSKKFGKILPSPPAGSAILAPGQKLPSPAPAMLPAQPPPHPPAAKSTTAKRKNWQDLLQDAAQDYARTLKRTKSTSPPPMEPFLALAGTTLLAALGTKSKSTTPNLSESEVESDGDNRMAVDGDEGLLQPKKEKRKRSRKRRVGH